MKILIHRQDWGHNEMRRLYDEYGGVDYYRLVKPAQYIKGHEVELVGIDIRKYGTGLKRWETIFKKFDVVWLSYFLDAKVASQIFYCRDKYKKKVIVDVDDNYLDILPSNPIYDKFKQTKRDRAILSTTLFFADVITVSTEPLKQRMLKHFKEVHNTDKNIVVIPNYNDVKDWQFPLGEKRRLTIGYAGSNSHQDDIEMIAPALGKLMDKYPELHFETIGCIESKMLPIFKNWSESALLRCSFQAGTWYFKEYPPILADKNWDIAMAPLVDSSFTRCKSHIKWLEMSMFKIPVVASDVYPYFMDINGKQIIEHEKTGLLVKPSEWFDALESLIIDEKKRKEMGRAAYDYVIKTWQYGDEINDIISKMLAKL